MVSPEQDRQNISAPAKGLGKGLLHADIQRQELRGDLLEELPFGFDGGQRMNLLTLLVFVAEDLNPSGETSAATLLPSLSRNRATFI